MKSTNKKRHKKKVSDWWYARWSTGNERETGSWWGVGGVWLRAWRVTTLGEQVCRERQIEGNPTPVVGNNSFVGAAQCMMPAVPCAIECICICQSWAVVGSLGLLGSGASRGCFAYRILWWVEWLELLEYLLLTLPENRTFYWFLVKNSKNFEFS